MGGQPLVEGDVEVEELLFAVDGVDHLDVELGAFEGWVVELADVVEEVSGECAVRVDGGAVEAEVGVVLGDLLIDGLVVDGDGRQRHREGDLAACGAFGREETALDVVVGGGGDLVVVDGDELDASVVERERGVAVVGEDDADGQHAVLNVGEAKEVAVFGIVTWVGGDGYVLVGMSVEGRVLIGRFRRWGLFVGCEEICREEAGGGC